MKSCMLRFLIILAISPFLLSATAPEQATNSDKNNQEVKKLVEDKQEQKQETAEKTSAPVPKQEMDNGKVNQEFNKPNDNAKQQGEDAKQEKQDKKDNQDKGEDKDKKEKAPEPSKLLKVGNLAFRTSQQPVPLVAFGQNLIDENQVVVQLFADYIKGNDQYFIDVEPAMIYGFLDNFSIFINAPYAVRFKQDGFHSSGPEDLLIQLEAAPYTEEHYTSYDQMTIVANVTIPRGSPKKNPPTGAGSNSFFLGMTYSTVGINWFYFSSYGGIFYASSHGTQFGNQFLYQAGVGKRIFSNADWLLDWMVEMDGTYSERSKIGGVIDPNSGGNVVVITPSLFLASKQSLVVQAGVGFPVVQQLFGHQNKNNYLLELKLSWAF
jgi:hypothetical protein